MLIIDLVSLALTLGSSVATIVLIVVIGVQEVYGHIKVVKRLLIEYLAAFIGIDMILSVRRVLQFNEATTIISLKLIYSLMLFSAVAIGYIATIIYRKPKSSAWKDIHADIFRSKIFLPFALFFSLILGIAILIWVAPLSVELGCLPSSTGRYVPIYDSLYAVAFHLAFIAFLLYPTPTLLLASYVTENAVISRYLRMFAISIIGLATSNYLQRFLLTSCSAATSDLIQIPCLIILTYVFRRMTALQRFYYVDTQEYIKDLTIGAKI